MTTALTTLPIHRWLTFSDSWSPASVEFLLDRVKADHPLVIYDPFVGCGTTSVVCAEKGMGTIGCDISSLAIATTRIKLEPPSEQALHKIEGLVKESELEKLLSSFASRTLSTRASGSLLQLLQFVLAAVLLRIGWHEGASLEMSHVAAEISKLVSEMRADSQAGATPLLHHRTYCSEFFALNACDIISFTQAKVAMISSPPFFGSNFNPAIRRLESLLGEPTLSTGALRRSPSWSVPEALPILNLFRREEYYNPIADYLFFLDRIVTHAGEIGCRAVALEMGPKHINGHEVRFDLFLAERLLANDYRIDLFETTELEPEPCTSICAHARAC